MKLLEALELQSADSKKRRARQRHNRNTVFDRLSHYRYFLTNHNDARGYTLVTAAAADGRTQVLEYLREAGYDPFFPDRDARTGENIARELGHTNVLEWYANLRNESSREQ